MSSCTAQPCCLESWSHGSYEFHVWWQCCQNFSPWRWLGRFFCSFCLLVSGSFQEAWLGCGWNGMCPMLSFGQKQGWVQHSLGMLSVQRKCFNPGWAHARHGKFGLCERPLSHSHHSWSREFMLVDETRHEAFLFVELKSLTVKPAAFHWIHSNLSISCWR